MSENVFNLVQLGVQSGTMAAPGSAVAAIIKFPVEAPLSFELDRASTFAKQDRGRNVRNSAASGYHGVRMATTSLEADARYEDLCDILEMHYGAATLTGSAPYTRVYDFEADTPTVIPYTIQAANTDDSVSPMRMISCLVNELTLGFSDITAPGAVPLHLSAGIMGLDREVLAHTAALSSRPNLEVIQGHLFRLYEGTTATAFASLAEITGSLKAYTQTTTRNLVGRAYGGATDKAVSWGFSDQSNGTFEAKVAISATAKSDFLDIWNVAQPAGLGERRWRLMAAGTSSRSIAIDMRVGIMAVPIDESDGERVFKVTGEFVDDSTLDCSNKITVINNIADLTP